MQDGQLPQASSDPDESECLVWRERKVAVADDIIHCIIMISHITFFGVWNRTFRGKYMIHTELVWVNA